MNERNKILLGSFASLTLIQLITGILLVAVPHNSGKPSSTYPTRVNELNPMVFVCCSHSHSGYPFRRLPCVPVQREVRIRNHIHSILSVLRYIILNVRAVATLCPDGILDVVAFLSIVRSSSRDMTTISSLVRTLVRDATIYFIVIFTSHIILTFFVLFARVSVDFYSSGLPWNSRACRGRQEDIKLIPGV